ncbi:hypothetical protein [Lapillicoccus jejuensis]|uniref:Secreted protein n=1 Tax=Lapillicoccus jejuensis TaxID=402171 RepID=A0A542E175_9MICO|nr:hypothetical protein [Lapillicoccus jejuensis]TQJ09093.1 hypothetical protein FB458_2199 [Lapillicoccus jejuensis]
MTRFRRAARVSAVLLAVVPLAVSAGPAVAAPATPSGGAPITRYASVASVPLVAAPFAQTTGSVACPAGTHVLGGGAVLSLSDLSLDLAGSVPLPGGAGWQARVSNRTGGGWEFAVFAICASGIRGYRLSSNSVLNRAGTRTVLTATCPAGTVPLGGGGETRSSEAGASLGGIFPVDGGWRAVVTNRAVPHPQARAVAVCGEAPSGYVVVQGPRQVAPAGSSTLGAIRCPAGLGYLAGGVRVWPASPDVTVSGTFPQDDRWRVEVASSSDGASSLHPSVVCATVPA